MKISAIYKIKSIIKPDRSYIGSSQDIIGRLKLHLRDLRRNKHHSKKLQNHFNKYGESDLQFTILLGCDRKDLIKIEQYFLDSYKPYFNVLSKAGSHLGAKRSIESRKRISDSKKGIKHWLYGKHIPGETKEKLRKASLGNQYSKGIKQSEETKRKRSEKLRGHPNYLLKHTKETKQKMRESHKGQKAWNKGIAPSEETRIKLHNSLKGRIPWNKGITYKRKKNVA